MKLYFYCILIWATIFILGVASITRGAEIVVIHKTPDGKEIKVPVNSVEQAFKEAYGVDVTKNPEVGKTILSKEEVQQAAKKYAKDSAEFYSGKSSYCVSLKRHAVAYVDWAISEPDREKIYEGGDFPVIDDNDRGIKTVVQKADGKYYVRYFRWEDLGRKHPKETNNEFCCN